MLTSYDLSYWIYNHIKHNCNDCPISPMCTVNLNFGAELTPVAWWIEKDTRCISEINRIIHGHI